MTTVSLTHPPVGQDRSPVGRERTPQWYCWGIIISPNPWRGKGAFTFPPTELTVDPCAFFLPFPSFFYLFIFGRVKESLSLFCVILRWSLSLLFGDGVTPPFTSVLSDSERVRGSGVPPSSSWCVRNRSRRSRFRGLSGWSLSDDAKSFET